MRILYLDCGMGAAGDMLCAALLELIPDPDAFVEKLNHIGVPQVEYLPGKAEKCGIVGTHMTVLVNGGEEDVHMHDHPHEHHHHDHPHSSMERIEHLVRDHLQISDDVKEDILSVYRLIAQAESHVHGVPVTDIHFHEVGTMDALADIAAVCLLMRELAPDAVVASPVHVGSGTVKCAHGILPVPAPATALILQGVPTYGGRIDGELCTPTGAALLKHFATRFGDMPVMRTSAIGYGMGKKDFPAANCLRAMLGETDGTETEITELSCNVDDMTGEAVGFAMEKLFEGGALEVFTTPVGMKKSRPGILLTVICKNTDKERIVRLIFKHTTTIGVREKAVSRYTLDRQLETVDTPFGKLRRKRSSGYGVTRVKLEYDDLARIAEEEGLSLQEARELLKDYEW